jgi:predicted ATPase/DNA-binding SARP family transcriptional activator
MVYLQCFESLEVRVDGTPLPRLRTRKGYLLLVLLAMHAGKKVSRDYLIATLWPDSDQEDGAMSLRRALHDLRQALGDAKNVVLSPDKRHVQIDATHFDADVWHFENFHKENKAPEAIAIYNGPFLAGHYEDWVLQEQRLYAEKANMLLVGLAQEALHQENYEKAAELARRATQIEPLGEAAQIVLYNALAGLGDIAGARLAYRDFRLRLERELQQEPSEAIKQCLENLFYAKNISKQAVTKQTEAAPRTLPQFLSTFLGRTTEQERVSALLQQGRLTTILGPGGVGKTRLAVQVAHKETHAFPDGVFFIDLTTQSVHAAPELIWQLLASSLADARQAKQEGQSTIEQVTNVLGNKKLLLVLDNAEHLQKAVTQVAKHLLGAVPTLYVLVTSRIPLKIPGEQIYTLRPLPLPQNGNAETPESLRTSEAARLFLARTEAMCSDFTLTHQDAPAIAQICQLLDGLPLALELAAIRMRALTPTELAQRLAEPLPLLAGDEQFSERHRTLEHLITWSYTLLTEEEQRFFRYLAVFPDSFTLTMAEAVYKSNLTTNSDHFDLVAALVDNSLLQVSADSFGNTRYRQLETIRAFAQEKLEENSERSHAQTRLANWGKIFLERAYDCLWGTEGGLSIRKINYELPTLQAAIRHSDRENALHMARLLEQFWWRTNRLHEGIAWYTQALGKQKEALEISRTATPPEHETREQIACLVAREMFRAHLGEPNTFIESQTAAIETLEKLGDKATSFYMRHTLAVTTAEDKNHTDYQVARQHLYKNLALIPSISTLKEHQDFYYAYTYLGLVNILEREENITEMYKYAKQSFDIFTQLGRTSHATEARYYLARALLVLQRLPEAKEILIVGIQTASQDEMYHLQTNLLLIYAEVMIGLNDIQEARNIYQRILHDERLGEIPSARKRAQDALQTL